MIEIENLKKEFGSFVAVDHLSFSVGSGEVLGFLGPNGAGKSTTMKMLTGFLAPDGGTARICGHDIQQDKLAAQRCIGYLPEGAPLYGDMDAGQFLHFIASIRGFSGDDAEARVRKAVARLQLEEVYHQRIETLSKGFKRRVGLAQAILHEPKVLILDEPTDGLDPNQKQQVRELIRSLSQDRIVIISTHILEEVSAVCTRAIIIASGRIVVDGTPPELEARSRYHHAVSVQLRSPVPVNGLASLPGVETVEAEDDGRRITVVPVAGQRIFPQVDEYLREQDWEVDSMHVERGRLDEVFRRLTA